MFLPHFTIFTKGYNFSVFLFASLDDKAFPKWGQLLNERICSQMNKFFPLKVDPSCEERQKKKKMVNYISLEYI